MSSSSEFLSARFGLFVCFIALIGVGAYAYSLGTGLAAAERAAAQAVQEREALRTTLTAAEQKQSTTDGELSTCRQEVQDITAKLNEATKTRAGRRKTGG